MPDPASLDPTVQAALPSLGRPASACLLRRQGGSLRPEGPEATGVREVGSVALSAVMPGSRGGGDGPPPNVRIGEALGPLRSLTGPASTWALVYPLSPPSPEGGHDLYA